MGRSKSSQQWLQEHFNDPYVKRAVREGYRSRACYKLLEIQGRDKLMRQGMVVVDLGAAPGGWSQVASACVGASGRVIASDILPMDPLPGVEFLQGDFTDEPVYEALLSLLSGRLVDLVFSDMAPNMSGLKAVDQPRVMGLVELAVDFARPVLRPGGGFLAKVFHGEGFDELVRDLRRDFSKVLTRKPESSRARSSEVYVLARGYQPRS